MLKTVVAYYEAKIAELLKSVEDRLFQAIMAKLEERFESLYHKLESEILGKVRDLDIKFESEVENIINKLPDIVNVGLKDIVDVQMKLINPVSVGNSIFELLKK